MCLSTVIVNSYIYVNISNKQIVVTKKIGFFGRKPTMTAYFVRPITQLTNSATYIHK